mmetsp:Transcript_4248/g.8831  ORF Transcript_4248/g.8831 Transcript_4248/m.8831 type:complete len:224 (-) Transcript_4248:11-682(-)
MSLVPESQTTSMLFLRTATLEVPESQPMPLRSISTHPKSWDLHQASQRLPPLPLLPLLFRITHRHLLPLAPDLTLMLFPRLPPRRLAPESPRTLNLFQSLPRLQEVLVSIPMLEALSPPRPSVDLELLHMPILLTQEFPLSQTRFRHSADLPSPRLEVKLHLPWEVSLDVLTSAWKPVLKWLPSLSLLVAEVSQSRVHFTKLGSITELHRSPTTNINVYKSNR